MAVRAIKRRGKTRLVIDIPYRDEEGAKRRYQRDSIATTKTAALEEERRIKNRIAETGSPYGFSKRQEDAKTIKEVLRAYREEFVTVRLKASTQVGYRAVLKRILDPESDRPIGEVERIAERVEKLGAQEGLKKTTRNNVLAVIKSFARFAHERGWLSKPAKLPKLRRIGQTVLDIPCEEDVQKLFGAVRDPSYFPWLGLMAFAGLRPNEVRALRWKDIDLEKRRIRIRQGECFGVVAEPKTGERIIPIDPKLLPLLLKKRGRDEHVAITRAVLRDGKPGGRPWSNTGLSQAFRRLRNQAKLAGWSLYSLRHFAITRWLRLGVPLHVVMKMAGHSNLETTQKYVHAIGSDLDAAAETLDRASSAR